MGTEHTEARPAPLRGYRVLANEEKAALDRIKLMEAEVGQLWQSIYEMPDADRRCLKLARNGLQDAFMWFVRGVARPLDVFEENIPMGDEPCG